MKIFLTFFLTIFSCLLIAGLFGILHDQATYSISHEYFTKFKFRQFGLYESDNENAIMPNPRQAVAIVGFMATWWVGVIIGFVLSLTATLTIEQKKIFKVISKAVFLVFLTTISMSILGFLYGKFYLSKVGVNWWLPENLVDKNNFIIVGSIHNFSYIGGALGLLISVVYLVRKKNR